MNLGCVTYSETKEGLKAEWVFSGGDHTTHGTGVAVRLSKQATQRKFEGEYEIIYTSTDWDQSPKLELTISYTSGCYQLEWRHNGVLTDIGIGMENGDKMVASYTKAT